ncbi:hypothetical protein [Polaribacter cellanae]|uniref:Uncharacterized protein n=1 Tax=Polaribacter cellanae TaxID=2818493 RepID=A0A975CRN4_9FLAO|nr:hypothetical protein [Polaribacter cellanae]QTE21986.1 hypothetical protein J3359_14375 [Polaribacter cellanae]
MKGKFKFSKEERNLLRNSINSFQNEIVKDSLTTICGAGHSRSHVNDSWDRSSGGTILVAK